VYGPGPRGNGLVFVARFHNRYATPRLPPNPLRREYEQRLMTRPPVRLNRPQRRATEDSIRETCKTQNWVLWVTNVRTNHAHSVVTAGRLQFQESSSSAQS